jgi:Tol biopolymer transport system component
VAHPAYSPDGQWVAYYRVLAGQRDVWIVPAVGGDPVQFTDDPAADVHPAWSPDGTQLAFASEREGAFRIWVAPVADGRPAGGPRRLTAGPTTDRLPAWSPDGRWIAYVGVAPTGSQDVWVVDSVGSGRPRLLGTEGKVGAVAWDQGGSALFVSGRWDSWVSVRKYAFETGRRILLDPPIRFGQNPDLFEFGISQDGRSLAFGRDQVRGDIWVLEAQDRPF